MPALESDLRRQLETSSSRPVNGRGCGTVGAAEASRGCRRAVPAFHAAEKELRNRLRARGRQAGDVRHADKTQNIDQLAQELAYEYWHRMLFARFLAENHLLMHPDGVAVSLAECEELATDADPPARTASSWRPGTPARCCRRFSAPTTCCWRSSLPRSNGWHWRSCWQPATKTFMAEDSLGWVYQFWQSKRKDEVNKSGDKIDGRTLPAVTQLFTEHYMVQFLLHNTIGAWWCAAARNHRPSGRSGRSGWQGSPVAMAYLRWRDDGTPAAGTFDGWPKTLKEFKMLDPCCGSGHFLVAAFNLLVPLRMHDERMTAKEAVTPCCVKISSASNSIPDVRRSPHLPWRSRHGSTPARMASPWLPPLADRSTSPARAKEWAGQKKDYWLGWRMATAGSATAWSGFTICSSEPRTSAR